MCSMIRGVGFRYVVFVMLFVLASIPSLAIDEPKDLLDKAINDLIAQTQNAKVKAMNSVGGIGTQSRRPGGLPAENPMSPAGRCCGSNMEAIRDADRRARELLQVIRYELKSRNRQEGVSTIRSMNAQLDEMGIRVRQFAGTGEKDLAVDFLKRAQSALALLRKSKTELDSCCGDLIPKLPAKAVKNEG
jgi:hypothetical protein